MTADYANPPTPPTPARVTPPPPTRRTVHTLAGVTRLTLTIRRCHHPACPAHKKPYRPEAEGAVALPRHEFGLDVVALIGRLRYTEHRSVPEIRTHLVGRGVAVSERAVTNLLDRYDELLAVALADDRRLRKVLATQGKVVLGFDGLQPDVGHEVLWVWAGVSLAFGWVHRAARLLGQDGASGAAVRGQLSGLLGAMKRHRDAAGDLAAAVDHFRKVT